MGWAAMKVPLRVVQQAHALVGACWVVATRLEQVTGVLLGLLAVAMVVMGGGHSAASVGTWVTQPGGTESSLPLLLALGWVLVAGGVAVAFFAAWTWRGRRRTPILWCLAFLLGYLAIVNGPGVPLLILCAVALTLLLVIARRARATRQAT